MNQITELWERPQYSIPKNEKHSILLEQLSALCSHHFERCTPYRNILQHLDGGVHAYAALEDIPQIPVRLFKTMNMASIGEQDVFRVLTSSGTSSQTVSRILLDQETATSQVKALASIVTSFLGPKRLPMIIVDQRSLLNNRSSLSARAAGLLGLANFGRDHFFALNDQMELDIDGLHAFLIKHSQVPIFIFGFTFMIWRYLYQTMADRGMDADLSKGVLIHGGGWKKLQEQSVSNAVFKESLKDKFGLTRVHNFYGMVEQVGSIYIECEKGFLHAPNFGDVLTRNFRNWKPTPIRQQGVIQTLSVLPKSYPGHSLLTEDIGTIHGIDDCDCGRKGTYFLVEGRIPRTELRGCSDIHAFSTTQPARDEE